MIKNSFTLRVIVISFLFLALPLLIDSFIFFQSSYNSSIVNAEKMLRTEANYRASNLLNMQPVRDVFLDELIYVMNLGEDLEHPDQAKLNRVLSKIVHVGGEFAIYILKFEGPRYKIVASSDPDATDNYFVSYQLLPEMVKHGSGTFIRYTYSKVLNRYVPYVYMIEVIHSKEKGKPVGILMVTANVTDQMDALMEYGPIHENIMFAVLNKDSIVFAASDPELLGQHFEPISPQRREELMISEEISPSQLAPTPLPVIPSKNDSFFEFLFKDKVQIAYRAPSPLESTSLISYSPKEVFFGAAVRHFLLIYMLYGIILVIGAGVTYWFSLWISRPLKQLSHLMTQVSKGKLDARFKEEPFGFEINVLGELFNQTLDNLLQNIQRAEDERVKKETYENELSIVRQVQRSLLPLEILPMKGVNYAGFYLPAQSVGGDYYEFMQKKLKTGEEALHLAVVDASGKGIFSSLYAQALRALLRTYSTLTDDAGEVLNLSNTDFIQDATDKEISLQVTLALYGVDSKKFVYASCGRFSGFVRRSNGEILMLMSSGLAIGLNASEKYRTEELQLFTGDIVVIYTSGIVEARDENNQIFTEERLKNFVQAGHWDSAQAVIEGITAEVNAFTHSLAQEAEIIVVVLTVE